MAMARPEFDKLALALHPRAGWTDLVLPAREMEALRQIAVEARARSQAGDESSKSRAKTASSGLVVLFAGASGTGKTLAAEVLANELRRPLYRIDLSKVVSKYIGETEKNLDLVFADAEADGAILLFDEADALFGKRGNVKDSHDRYANIEVGYLLQRIESHPGLVILETNHKSAVDRAFRRRLRYIVDFPLPGMAERRGLWDRAIPSSAALDELDRRRLSRLEMSGARINAIAVDATAHAAAASVPVDMRLMMDALIRQRRKDGQAARID